MIPTYPNVVVRGNIFSKLWLKILFRSQTTPKHTLLSLMRYTTDYSDSGRVNISTVLRATDCVLRRNGFLTSSLAVKQKISCGLIVILSRFLFLLLSLSLFLGNCVCIQGEDWSQVLRIWAIRIRRPQPIPSIIRDSLKTKCIGTLLVASFF